MTKKPARLRHSGGKATKKIHKHGKASRLGGIKHSKPARLPARHRSGGRHSGGKGRKKYFRRF